MTKDEALKLALEALKMIDEAMPFPVAKLAQAAIKEALAESEPNYKKALEVWLDKTEWVQETVKPHELGMHRADVLKQRIEEALAQPEQEPVEWGVDWGPDGNSVSIIKRLADGGIEVVGWEYAPHPPQRTWVGLTNEEIKKIVGSDRYTDLLLEVVNFVEAKLKERNG